MVAIGNNKNKINTVGVGERGWGWSVEGILFRMLFDGWTETAQNTASACPGHLLSYAGRRLRWLREKSLQASGFRETWILGSAPLPELFTVVLKTLDSNKNVNTKHLGRLPWWLSGKESTCQWRRHRFDPWSRNILHAAEQLCPCALSTEPVLESPGAASTEPLHCTYWSLSNLEPVLQTREAPHTRSPRSPGKSSLCSPQLEKSLYSDEDSAPAKVNTHTSYKEKKPFREFPGGPVVRTSHSHFRGHRLDP